MHIHLQYTDATSNKFWEISVAGASHTVRFGKIGTQGQEKTKAFSSAADALKDATALVASKRKGGYVDTAGNAPTAKATPAPAAKAPATKKATAAAGTGGVVSVEVPLLVRTTLVAGGDRVAVDVGGTLVVLSSSGTQLVADPVAEVSTLRESVPALAGGFVFFCDAEGGLHACSKQRGAWTNTTIFQQQKPVTFGRGLAAAQDTAGHVWVVAVTTAKEMVLLSNRSGAFAEEARFAARGRPFRDDDAHRFVDIACDGTVPVIAAVDGEDLMVGRFEGGKVKLERVRENAGGWVCVAVAPGGVTHVAYLSWAGAKNDVLEVATHTKAGWSFEIVDNKGNAGYAARMVLVEGAPVVVYAERSTRYAPERTALSNRATRVARRTASGWTTAPFGDAHWALAPVMMNGHLVLFSGPAPLEESAHLQLTSEGPAPHPAGAAVAGAPTPQVLLLGGLKLRLLEGKPVYVENRDRFWEIALGKKSHAIRIGKVGAAGSTKTATFGSDDEAREAALKALDKKYNSDFFKEPAVAAVENAQVDEMMAKMRAAAVRSLAEDEKKSAARQANTSTDKLPVFWDTLGVDGPLLGRLRGVVARGEIRQHLSIDKRIYFEAKDPHFVFRGPVPKTLPDFLTNAERQLVVSKKLAEALKDVPKLKPLPVRLLDVSGKEVSKEYVLLEVNRVSECIESEEFDRTGYYYAKLVAPRAGKAVGAKLPPLSRASRTLLIACDNATAAVVAPFSGVRLIPLAELNEVFWPPPEVPYHLARAGDATEFALFKSKEDFEEAFDKGISVADKWPNNAVMKMTGNKSWKKITALMRAPGAPIVNAAVKALLEKMGGVELEFLPVKLKDHGNADVPGTFFVLNVLATRPYVDLDESDVESSYGFLREAREVVVNADAFADRPALFRVPGARYPWVFVRVDVIEALEKAKLEGLRGTHPAKYAYPTESGGLRSFC